MDFKEQLKKVLIPFNNPDFSKCGLP